MFLNPLDRVLKQLIQKPEWEKYRQHCQMMECWQQVVNRQILKNTRPLYIDRQTLYVATSSAVWAQELALQRYSLIKKLNFRLDFIIKDIRFSPACWQNQQKSETTEVPFLEVNLKKLQAEKATTEATEKEATEQESNLDAKTTIKKCLENMQKNCQNLVTCPQCQSLTPQAELTRWQVCRHCIAQKWHSEYRPPRNEERGMRNEERGTRNEE